MVEQERASRSVGKPNKRNLGVGKRTRERTKEKG